MCRKQNYYVSNFVNFGKYFPARNFSPFKLANLVYLLTLTRKYLLTAQTAGTLMFLNN